MGCGNGSGLPEELAVVEEVLKVKSTTVDSGVNASRSGFFVAYLVMPCGGRMRGTRQKNLSNQTSAAVTGVRSISVELHAGLPMAAPAEGRIGSTTVPLSGT